MSNNEEKAPVFEALCLAPRSQSVGLRTSYFRAPGRTGPSWAQGSLRAMISRAVEGAAPVTVGEVVEVAKRNGAILRRRVLEVFPPEREDQPWTEVLVEGDDCYDEPDVDVLGLRSGGVILALPELVAPVLGELVDADLV